MVVSQSVIQIDIESVIQSVSQSVIQIDIESVIQSVSQSYR